MSCTMSGFRRVATGPDNDRVLTGPEPGVDWRGKLNHEAHASLNGPNSRTD